MKRLSSYAVLALLTFTLGVATHTTARFLFGCGALGECWGTFVKAPLVEDRHVNVKAPAVEDRRVRVPGDGTFASCDEFAKAWEAGKVNGPIPSEVQLRCWGADEGKAHTPAQTEAHTRGH